MKMKTESGRFSRTKIAAAIGGLLQIVNGLLVFVGWIDTKIGFEIAGVLGIFQSWLKWALRNITDEAIDKTPKVGTIPPSSAAILFLVVFALGCSNKLKYPSSCSIEKKSGVDYYRTCKCEKLVFDWYKKEDGWEGRRKCDDEAFPEKIFTKSLPAGVAPEGDE